MAGGRHSGSERHGIFEWNSKKALTAKKHRKTCCMEALVTRMGTRCHHFGPALMRSRKCGGSDSMSSRAGWVRGSAFGGANP